MNTCTKVFLRQKAISGGRISLYLDFYPAIRNPHTNRMSRRETLGIYIYASPKNERERQFNSSMLEKAEAIRCRRFEQLLNEQFDFLDKEKLRMDFLAYFKQKCRQKYQKWDCVLRHFEIYCKGKCRFCDLTVDFCKGFRTYLLSAQRQRNNGKGPISHNSAAGYWSTFRALLKMAYQEKYLRENVNDFLEKIEWKEVKKEFLTLAEVKLLVATPCKIPVLKQAVLFSCMTGLRISDILQLSWEHIQMGQDGGYLIRMCTEKTEEETNLPFEVYYINMSPAARSPRWLVYKHEPIVREVRYTRTEDIEKYFGISFDDDEFSPEELITAIEIVMPKLEELYNKKVRHYIIKQHTLLVCQQFEKYAFELNTKVMNIDLMRLVLAMHDIGKAIDRATQHTHTLSLIREFWSETPFTDYELKLVEVLLKDDHLGNFFQGRYNCSMLQDEIKKDAECLQIDASCLLQLKMVLYQCDIASYTKDAGGLKYLEHMFVYENKEKTFDEENGLLAMSAEYWSRYEQLKSVII